VPRGWSAGYVDVPGSTKLEVERQSASTKLPLNAILTEHRSRRKRLSNNQPTHAGPPRAPAEQLYIGPGQLGTYYLDESTTP